MPSRVRVFVDFDGTISLEDTTDVILERFAQPEWRRIEADWLEGKIGSHECMAKQIDLVRASPAALDEVVREVPIDPHFGEFVSLCRKHAIPVTVVSDGLDHVIGKMLAQAGVSVPVIANRMKWMGGDRWRLEFPAAQAACRTAAGNCKCAALTREPHTLRVLIGDGRSDFCAAEAADLVVAKGALAEHCHATGLPYLVFGNFAGATTLVADWLATLERRGRVEPAATAHYASPSA
jgi:2-hydroxy-3-keto-5-methylthiopentenyl-1-phosphate phosphatase